MARLSDLVQRRSFGFGGPEGEMFDEANSLARLSSPMITNQSIAAQRMPQNYIQRTGGQVLDMGPSGRDVRIQGMPAILSPDNEGLTVYAPSGKQYHTNMTDQRQIEAERKQLQELADLPRRMALAKVQEQEMKAKGGDGAQRGQLAYDQKGRAFIVNPYTTKATPVEFDGEQMRGAQYSPALQGDISSAKKQGAEQGQAVGEAIVKLEDVESMMPRLIAVTNELSALGKKATYTTTGKVRDVIKRELGMDVGDSAVARKEYISKVDNEILPLLRQTFGAAFTQKEGDSLKATLGDPDVSPPEKDAVLRSFIQTKKGQIAALQRRTSSGRVTYPHGATQSDTPKVGAIVDGYVYVGGDPANPASWKGQ